MNGCSITWKTDEVLAKLDSMKAKTRASLQIIADSAVKAMESYAKTNARWTDRTGNARQRLRGETRWESDALIAAITHNVDYGIWLELCNEKKYAILEDALNSQAQNLLSAYQQFLNRLGG